MTSPPPPMAQVWLVPAAMAVAPDTPPTGSGEVAGSGPPGTACAELFLPQQETSPVDSAAQVWLSLAAAEATPLAMDVKPGTGRWSVPEVPVPSSP
jgi:hypothetical protein